MGKRRRPHPISRHTSTEVAGSWRPRSYALGPEGYCRCSLIGGAQTFLLAARGVAPSVAWYNPVPVDTAPSPPQTRAVSKAAPVPKGPVLPRRTPTPPVSTPIPVEEAQPADTSPTYL